MGTKEIRIKHDKIQDSNTITDVNKKLFKENGLDIHQDEVKDLTDDHDRGERIIRVKAPKKYFFISRK